MGLSSTCAPPALVLAHSLQGTFLETADLIFRCSNVRLGEGRGGSSEQEAPMAADVGAGLRLVWERHGMCGLGCRGCRGCMGYGEPHGVSCASRVLGVMALLLLSILSWSIPSVPIGGDLWGPRGGSRDLVGPVRATQPPALQGHWDDRDWGQWDTGGASQPGDRPALPLPTKTKGFSTPDQGMSLRRAGTNPRPKLRAVPVPSWPIFFSFLSPFFLF